MTLNDLFDSGICLQGKIKIQSWDNDEPTIHYNGYAEEFYPNEYENIINREISYIFPYMECAICIEIV